LLAGRSARVSVVDSSDASGDRPIDAVAHLRTEPDRVLAGEAEVEAGEDPRVDDLLDREAEAREVSLDAGRPAEVMLNAVSSP
jgi:hypothetical protein